MQGRTETSEGLDVKLSLHYFNRMAFILQLAPLMTGPDPRVLSVLAAGVHAPYPHYKEDLEVKQHYSLKNAADAATLYNDVSADALSREFPGITFSHILPGFVATNWGTELPAVLRWAFVRPAQKLFARSIDDCAEFMVDALFNPALKGGFHLLSDSAVETKRTAEHDDARESVWPRVKELLNSMM
mmetsp:Transcript_44348/g.104171  ORF Transcript_44348/g.104171 Transcript_44348/m.104171 type:complete len:186 (+) Transcript_44348:167-724(+)